MSPVCIARFPQVKTMPADNPKLGFIGAGMMSSAMINGIIAAKVRCETRKSAKTSYLPPAATRSVVVGAGVGIGAFS